MLGMALSRRSVSSRRTEDVTECAEAAGNKTHTSNAGGAGVIADQLEARGRRGGAEDEMPSPASARRSAPSVLFHSRLSSRVFTSPPKKLLGHLAVCGDRLRHRAGARTKNEENNEDDGVTLLESKAPLTPAADVSSSSSAVPVNPLAATVPTESKPGDRLLPSPDQEESCAEARRRQEDFAHRDQQLALQGRQQQQQQDATESEEGTRKGGGGVHTRKLEEQDEQDEPKRSIINKGDSDDAKGGTHTPDTEKPAPAEKTSYPLLLHSHAGFRDPARAYLKEPERSFGHRCSTSTTASRRSSNGSENVPTPATSFASLSLDAHGSGDITGLYLTATSSVPIPSSINITRHDGVKQEDDRKPHSTESDDRDGLNPVKAKYIGEDADGGESSSSSSNSSRELGNCREDGRGIEDDRVETAGGLVEAGVGNPHVNDNGAHHASSITPAAAGRACESLGSVASESASDHHHRHHHLSHETNASLHDDASPLLMLPRLADETTTSAPEYSGSSVSLSYASGTLSGGGSSASSAAVSSVDSSRAHSTASCHATFPPGARSAASREAAAPASRFKKSVGMRLSGMLHQGRTVLKFGSAEKEAVTTGRILPRSRTVPNLTLETERTPPDISAKNSPSSSKLGAGTTSSSSESSRLSLFRRPSPLLLHQLCRRAPGTGHHPARPARPDGPDTSTADDDVSAGTGGEQQVGRHQRENLKPDAALLPGVDAGAVVSETTAESTCPAGVLRRGREEADARREVGSKTDRTRETPRRVVGGRSGRRQTTSGVLDTSGDNGGEQVKCVRFGTMSIHVYAREARIRSRSSDSVDFAVTLDPPVPTDSYWRRIRECTKREYEGITDDFDDLGSGSAEEDESEDDGEEEEGVDDGGEEEKEVLRGYPIDGTLRHHRLAATGGSHHDHHVLSHDDFSDGVEHTAVAAHGRHRGPAVEELLPTPHTGEGPHIGTRGHETEGGLCVTGELFLKNAEEILGTYGGQGGGDMHIGHAYGSNVSTPFALDSHDLAKTDHHGRRSPHGSHGGFVDTCPSSNQEQRRRSDTHEEHLRQHQIVEMKEQSNEEEGTAAATNALRSSYAQCAPDGPGSSLESSKVREDTTEVGLMFLESGSSLESCGAMSLESTPSAHGHQHAKPDAAAAPHARIRRHDSEVNSADWWRSLLNRSSISSQEYFGDIPHHEQLVTRGDKKGDIVEAAAAGQESAHTPLIASSNNGGESSASKLLDENGTVYRGESGSSVPGSQDQQSLKNKENLEGGLEEQRAPGLEQTQPTTSRTRNSSAPQLWAPRASSHGETGWPSLSWKQSATKGHGTMEKGMTAEFTKGRRPFGVDPRRVLSDDHSRGVYSSTHGHSVLTASVTRRREDEGESQQQVQPEVKKSPLVLKTEAVVLSSGHTQDQHVSDTDDSSSGFLHIYGMQKDLTEKDSQGGTRGEQPRTLQREKVSSLPDRPILPGESESHGSRGSISCDNSRASTGVFSKNNSARSSHDLSSEYTSSDLSSLHDWQSACGSSRSSSSLLKVHSTGVVNQPATAAGGTAKQHDLPQGGHQLVLQQQISGKSDDFAHVGERGPPKGSSSSITSGGRRSLDEEVLNKATEEAIARSSSHLSAEEKENLRDILRGWCS